MADIPFGYLCEVDRVEKLEDGTTDKYDRQLMQHDEYDSTFPINQVLR